MGSTQVCGGQRRQGVRLMSTGGTHTHQWPWCLSHCTDCRGPKVYCFTVLQWCAISCNKEVHHFINPTFALCISLMQQLRVPSSQFMHEVCWNACKPIQCQTFVDLQNTHRQYTYGVHAPENPCHKQIFFQLIADYTVIYIHSQALQVPDVQQYTEVHSVQYVLYAPYPGKLHTYLMHTVHEAVWPTISHWSASLSALCCATSFTHSAPACDGEDTWAAVRQGGGGCGETRRRWVW